VTPAAVTEAMATVAERWERARTRHVHALVARRADGPSRTASAPEWWLGR
jgi:hypothetical protein